MYANAPPSTNGGREEAYDTYFANDGPVRDRRESRGRVYSHAQPVSGFYRARRETVIFHRSCGSTPNISNRRPGSTVFGVTSPPRLSRCVLPAGGNSGTINCTASERAHGWRCSSESKKNRRHRYCRDFRLASLNPCSDASTALASSARRPREGTRSTRPRHAPGAQKRKACGHETPTLDAIRHPELFPERAGLRLSSMSPRSVSTICEYLQGDLLIRTMPGS